MFFLPHEVLEFLVTQGKDVFTAELNSALDIALKDWCRRMVVAELVAGLGLWGDSAPFLTRDSVFVMLMDVLTGTYHDRLVLCAFAKSSVCACGCGGRHTFNKIFAVIKWSARALAAGVHCACMQTVVCTQAWIQQTQRLKSRCML